MKNEYAFHQMKRKKTIRNCVIRLTCALTCLLSFTACFDFIEKIELNEDGTGKATFKLNLSQSKTKLSTLMMLDSIRGYKIPSEREINVKLSNLVQDLDESSGISKVIKKEDWDNFIFEISCDFESVIELDLALKHSFENDKNLSKLFFNPYEFTQDKFERREEQKDLSEFKDDKNQNMDVLAEANYIAIFRLPYEIKTLSNSKYSLSKSKKTAFFKSTFLDLIDRKTKLQTTITFQ